MNPIINDESYCPICYDLLTMENCVTFIDCSHSFCQSCSAEIIFQKIVSCPYDRTIVTAIQQSNSHIHLKNYQRNKCNSDEDFVKEAFVKDWKSFNLKIVSNLKMLIKSLIKCFQAVVKVLSYDSNEVDITDLFGETKNSFFNITSILKNPRPEKLIIIKETLETNEYQNTFHQTLLAMDNQLLSTLEKFSSYCIIHFLSFKIDRILDKQYLEQMEKSIEYYIGYYADILKVIHELFLTMKKENAHIFN